MLTEGYAYDSLVNQPASLTPGLVRVEPGDAQLVAGADDRPDDAARLHDARMPLASQPLTDNQIATIVNWIENGALRN